MKETVFWKNYFHHCEKVKAEHEVGGELVDIPQSSLVTPGTSEYLDMAHSKQPSSPPKVKSIGDFVLVGIEGDNLDDLADEITRESSE